MSLYIVTAYIIGVVLAYDMEVQLMKHELGKLYKDYHTPGSKFALGLFATGSWLTIIGILILRTIRWREVKRENSGRLE